MMNSPANDALVRAGILRYLLRNEAGTAAKLRWGYGPYQRGTQRAGYGPKAHQRILAGLHQLVNTYVALGGQANTLRYVIMAGGGNRVVITHNPAGLRALLARDPDYQALQRVTLTGLAGEESKQPGGSLTSILKLVLPLILKLLGGLLSVKQNDPDDPIPDEYLDPPPEEEVDPEESQEDVSGLGNPDWLASQMAGR